MNQIARLVCSLIVGAALLLVPAAGRVDVRAFGQPRQGILLLAHGGNPQWNDNVRALASRVDKDQPVEVAFGMATRANIQTAVNALAARGVTEIVAVPLFVSSHSSVVTSTQYLLGVRAEAPPELAVFAKMSHGAAHGAAPAATGHEGHAADPAEATRPVKSPVPVRMSSALDSHPIVAAILADRARAISTEPAREAVILVAHGPVSDAENQQWLNNLGALAGGVRKSAAYASIDWMTVRDDAPAAIRDAATAELRALVAKRAQSLARASSSCPCCSRSAASNRASGKDSTASTTSWPRRRSCPTTALSIGSRPSSPVDPAPVIRLGDVPEAIGSRVRLCSCLVSPSCCSCHTCGHSKAGKADAEYLRSAYDSYRAMLESSPYRGVTWQPLGPTNISGRATDIAVADKNGARRIYAAYATSGVWKTDDDGASWQAIFEHHASTSIGDIAVAPSNPDIVWVGTGEANLFRASMAGVGVYKSTDGANTFTHSGLTDTQTIARIVVHPTNPDVVYVAASGHEWTDNEMRGVFKTTDGGRTWSKSFYRSPRTGAIDLVMDPADPNTLYAAMWQRVRRKWSDPRSEPGYTEGGIWKTTDAGKTWTEANEGLPAAQFRGRIGLDVARSNPNVVYAFVDNYEPGRPPRDGERDAYTRPIFESPHQVRRDLPLRRQRRGRGGRSPRATTS